MYKLASHIKAVSLFFTYLHWSIPIETQFCFTFYRKWLNCNEFLSISIISPNIFCTLHFAVDNIFSWMFYYSKTITITNSCPVSAFYSSGRFCWSIPRSVILQTTINIVRFFIINTNMIKL